MKLPTLPPFVRQHKKAAIAALVVVALLAAYFLFGGKSSARTTLVVTRGDVAEEVAVSGTVKAAESADLGFAASGRISGTYAVVGQHVGAGTVLAQIDNGDEQAAVARARAKLDALLRGTRPEEIASTETLVEGDQVALADSIRSAYVAADDAVRNHADALFVNPINSPAFKYPNGSALRDAVEQERSSLNDSFALWRSALDTLTPAGAAAAAAQAQTNLSATRLLLDNLNRALSEALPDKRAEAATYASSIASARTNVAEASAALTKAQNVLASDQKTLALKRAGSAREDVEAGRADLADALAALGKTRVVAPFAGIITKMDAKAGEIVSPAASSIAMQSDSSYRVEIYIPELSIAGVVVGNAATTTLDAYGAVPFAARVVAVDPAETLKEGVPTYKTTLELLTRDSRVRSGMTANVAVTTGVLKNAIVIPAGALGHESGGGAYVSVLVGKKKTEHRAVVTGATPALGKVEIKEGLQAGETILLTPQ